MSKLNISRILKLISFYRCSLEKQYASALIGTGKAKLDVAGPYDTAIRVVNYYEIKKDTIALLKLEHDVNHTRYVVSLKLSTR